MAARPLRSQLRPTPRTDKLSPSPRAAASLRPVKSFKRDVEQWKLSVCRVPGSIGWAATTEGKEAKKKPYTVAPPSAYVQ